MKATKSFLLLLSFLATSLAAPAQDNAEPMWYIVDYMKVKPGMWDKYLECEKVWKTIHAERKRAGVIAGWELFQLRYPSGTANEYDFVTVTWIPEGWNGVGKLDASWDAAYKVVPKDKVAIVDATGTYRDFVKTEIIATEDVIYKKEGGNSNFVMVNFMDVPDGRWEEYMTMETKLVKPVHQMNVDAGKRNGWGMYSLVMPYGANLPYNVITVDFYDKWEDMGGGVDGAWKKAHPDMSEAYVNRQINETRTLVKAEMWELVDAID